MRRCVWCRAHLGAGELSISHQVAGDARLAHAKYQIELQGKADAFTGFIEVCGECATAVRKAVLGAYLERRKSAPDSVEQIENLEAQAVLLEKRRLDEAGRREAAEGENRRLKEQLAVQKRQLQRSVDLLSLNVEEMLAAKNEVAEAIEGELEPEEKSTVYPDPHEWAPPRSNY
jgi:hypothetical protein